MQQDLTEMSDELPLRIAEPTEHENKLNELSDFLDGEKK
jgi:hypothetical protein